MCVQALDIDFAPTATAEVIPVADETALVNAISVTNMDVERIEDALLKQGAECNCPLTHRFAPGVYLREIFMEKGLFVIGHEHKTEHFNIVLSGRASVLMNGHVEHIKGGDVFTSQPGVRKVLVIHEDMRWQTVHPTQSTDLKTLENELIVHSASYTVAELKKAQEALQLK